MTETYAERIVRLLNEAKQLESPTIKRVVNQIIKNLGESITYEEGLSMGKKLDNKIVSGGIPSTPPSGKKKVLNIWWDPDTQELVFDKEE